VRLLAPGWEGNVNVKWLTASMSSTSRTCSRRGGVHTDFMPDGTARRLTFVMEAKSVITRPAGGQELAGPRAYEISGLAWSGAARSCASRSPRTTARAGELATLSEPVRSKAFTRFVLPWRWDDRRTTLRSRCGRRDRIPAADSRGVDRRARHNRGPRMDTTTTTGAGDAMCSNAGEAHVGECS
jgi:sulfane dehydrogenase subunit SoxC